MSWLRKDPFGAAWVLISPERGLRPSDFGSADGRVTMSDVLPLAPGREAGLPAEIQALRPSGSPVNGPDWRARVLPMPGGAFSDRPFTPVKDGLLLSAPASGWQELVVEHPDPTQRLETFSTDHLVELLRLYRGRVAHHAARPEVRHVQVNRNVGKAAGALYDHPHGQLLAQPVPNRWVEEERDAARHHHENEGRCLFCEVLAQELERRERVVTANEHFVVISPFASKMPFETWILPRAHQSGFHEVASNRLEALAEVLRSAVEALNTALDRPPYNLVLHTVPQEGSPDYHWHFELLPRLTRQAGFDWSIGAYVNPTPPEAAARFLREAIAAPAMASVEGTAMAAISGAATATVAMPGTTAVAAPANEGDPARPHPTTERDGR